MSLEYVLSTKDEAKFNQLIGDTNWVHDPKIMKILGFPFVINSFMHIFHETLREESFRHIITPKINFPLISDRIFKVEETNAGLEYTTEPLTQKDRNKGKRKRNFTFHIDNFIEFLKPESKPIFSSYYDLITPNNLMIIAQTSKALIEAAKNGKGEIFDKIRGLDLLGFTPIYKRMEFSNLSDKIKSGSKLQFEMYDSNLTFNNMIRLEYGMQTRIIAKQDGCPVMDAKLELSYIPKSFILDLLRKEMQTEHEIKYQKTTKKDKTMLIIGSRGEVGNASLLKFGEKYNIIGIDINESFMPDYVNGICMKMNVTGRTKEEKNIDYERVINKIYDTMKVAKEKGILSNDYIDVMIHATAATKNIGFAYQEATAEQILEANEVSLDPAIALMKGMTIGKTIGLYAFPEVVPNILNVYGAMKGSKDMLKECAQKHDNFYAIGLGSFESMSNNGIIISALRRLRKDVMNNLPKGEKFNTSMIDPYEYLLRTLKAEREIFGNYRRTTTNDAVNCLDIILHNNRNNYKTVEMVGDKWAYGNLKRNK